MPFSVMTDELSVAGITKPRGKLVAKLVYLPRAGSPGGLPPSLPHPPFLFLPSLLTVNELELLASSLPPSLSLHSYGFSSVGPLFALRLRRRRCNAQKVARARKEIIAQVLRQLSGHVA